MSSHEEADRISKVLFELASDRRVSILFEVEKQNLKMQKIAEVLDMNVTETFRHLQRLSESKLVEKRVDGAYAITSLGVLAIGLLTNLDFILKNGNYFLEHDLSCLPYEFVNRLGEISNAEFCGDTVVITVLMIAIFFVIGGIACNYYNTYMIDPILTIMLGILVFVDAGVIMCSRNKSAVVV